MKQVIKPLVLNVWLPNSPILGLQWGAAPRHSHIGVADLGARVAEQPGMGLQRDKAILVIKHGI